VVKEIKKNKQTLYACEECGFAYESKEWAEKCQGYCSEHGACSMEITRHAVGRA